MSRASPPFRSWLPVAIAVGAGAALLAFAGAPPPAHAAGRPAHQALIEIPDAGCAACLIKVRKAVKAAGGVIDIRSGQRANQLVVRYRPGASRPQVYVKAIRSAGFPRAKQVGSR